MPAARHYTESDLAAMPDDGNRYELVYGELLVTPAPALRHQLIVRQLVAKLSHYLEPYELDNNVVMAPTDVMYAIDTVVQPDLFVADTAAAARSNRSADIKALYLAIEVISPSSLRADRVIKRQLYQEQGVAEYWVVDGAQRQVEVWTPAAKEPRIERGRLVWRHPALDVSCKIDLVRLFDFG